jgi:cytochrome b561
MRPSRYILVAIILHWVMAFGILAFAGIGLAMRHLTLNPLRLFQWVGLDIGVDIDVVATR